jgi:hypothetical protein
MATYLDPKPSEVEIIESIKSHLPSSVQRTMVNNKLDSIEETLDLLKRIERTEQPERYDRETDINNGKREYQGRTGFISNIYDRNKDRRRVQRVQYHPRYTQNIYMRGNKINCKDTEREEENGRQGISSQGIPSTSRQQNTKLSSTSN